MMFIASLIATILGVFVFLFIFWKRQKEDFSSDIIFKIASHALFGIGIGYLVSFYFLKSYWLWFSFFGAVIGLLIAVYRLKIKFYEVLEAFVIAALPWLGGLFLLNSVLHSSLSSFLGFLLILIIIFISYWLDAHYKTFHWYKSGKIGFSGLAVLAIIFLVRFGLALSGMSVLSFVSKFEYILSGIGFLISSLLLVNLGRTKE